MIFYGSGTPTVAGIYIGLGNIVTCRQGARRSYVCGVDDVAADSHTQVHLKREVEEMYMKAFDTLNEAQVYKENLQAGLQD